MTSHSVLLGKRIFRDALIAILFTFFFSSFAAAIRCEKGEMFEIPLIALHDYSQPVQDVSIECTFIGKDGKAVTIPGFWNGEHSYLIRYAFQDTGAWSYTIASNQSTDSGINNQSGSVIVLPSSNTWNPFLTKGRPTVSANGHYLTYKNGEPFFYLASTCWEITWKSTLEQVKRFVSNLKMKNYNAAQLVVLCHQQMWPWGIINQNGDSAFIGSDFYLPNPGYMDYLDSIVKTMNDSGVIAVIAPLWAATTEVNYNPNGNYWKYMPKDQSLKWVKYIGSRYAGSNVMWIIAGDNYYPDSNGIRTFWKDFATQLRKASGPDHLLSMHCGTGVPSYEVFDNTTDVLDFHMYQSSHYMEGNNLTWQNALDGFRLNPRKPVIDDETCYEDIYNHLWAPGETTSVYTYRIRAEHIRKAQYEAVLSGSIIGISYGANGVFQWNVPGIPPTHNPSFFVDSAWNLPGSYQMSIARSILEKYQWYDFAPAPDLLKSSHSSFIPISFSKNYLMLYLPKGDDYFQIDTRNYLLDSSMSFIDPITGNDLSHAVSYKEPECCLINKPDTNDWLAVFSIQKIFNPICNTPYKTAAKYFTINRIVQSRDMLSITFFYPGSSGIILFDLFTANGRLLTSRGKLVFTPGKYYQQISLEKFRAKGILILRMSNKNAVDFSIINIK